MPRMLSIREAAAESGLTYNALRQLCLSGQIVNIRIGTKFMINMDKLADFLNGELSPVKEGDEDE